MQGYNAQAVVDEGQIVLAAEITNTPGDFSNPDPMISTTLSELDRVGVTERPQVALADAQYWNEQQFDEVIANKHIQVLTPPDSGGATAPRRGRIGGEWRLLMATHNLTKLHRTPTRCRRGLILPRDNEHPQSPHDAPDLTDASREVARQPRDGTVVRREICAEWLKHRRSERRANGLFYVKRRSLFAGF